MSHGLSITNSIGVQLFTEGATPVQYYGRVTLGAGEHNRIFNIPTSIPCQFFHSGGGAYTEQENGYYKLITRATCTTYVFMAAKFLPKGPPMGIHVYNNDRELSFTGHRPLLSPKEMIRIDMMSGANPPTTGRGGMRVQQTLSYKPAIPGSLRARWLDGIPPSRPGPYWIISLAANGNQIGTWWYIHRWFHVNDFYGSKAADIVPVIDASFYDQFTSLGNYS